jgi:hypothetical protein
MRLVVHISKFYDWETVPSNVKVTDADIKGEKVKPSANGGWMMKVTKKPPGGTFTTVGMPEEQVIAKIIHEKTRPEGGRTLTRKEAVAFYMSENVMPQEAHRSWIKKIEVEDDRPDEKMIRSMLAPHTVAEATRVLGCVSTGTHKYEHQHEEGHPGNAVTPQRCMTCGHVEVTDKPWKDVADDLETEPNIDPSEVEAHVAAYLEPCDTEGLVDHLHKHFKVKAKVVS